MDEASTSNNNINKENGAISVVDATGATDITSAAYTVSAAAGAHKVAEASADNIQDASSTGIGNLST